MLIQIRLAFLRVVSIVCTSTFLPGVEPLTKFSKRGDLTLSKFLEEGCWERWGDLFQGCCSFYVKNKLKSEKEIFNDIKSLQTKMFFITKNLNWEILTMNLVTFKRWGIGFIYKRETAWKGWLEQFTDLRGFGEKEGVVVFLRGADTPMPPIVFPGGGGAQFDHPHPCPHHISRTNLISIKLHTIVKQPI